MVTNGLVLVKKVGGLLQVIVHGSGKLVSAILGNLISPKFWWEIAKRMGEAIGIAFCTALEEVFRKTKETLSGSSSWYGQRSNSTTQSASSSAFSRNNNNSFGNYWDRSTSYARPAPVPASTSMPDNTIPFSGFGR